MRQLLNKTLLLIAAFVLCLHVSGQTANDDLDLIKAHTYNMAESNIHEHHHSFLLSDHSSAIVKYNPVSLVLGGLMWTYQKVVSPQLSSSCLYSPTCSGYSKDLISDFGILKGLIFTADRLSRCNRLALMDYRIWEADRRTGKIRESTSYYKLHE